MDEHVGRRVVGREKIKKLHVCVQLLAGNGVWVKGDVAEWILINQSPVHVEQPLCQKEWERVPLAMA